MTDRSRLLASISPRSLRVQLLLWVALPVATLLFALSLTELRSHERAMQQLVQERADNWTRAAAALLTIQLEGQQDRLNQIARDPALHRIPVAWESILSPHRTTFPAGLAVWDETGTLQYRTDAADWAADPAVFRTLRTRLNIQAHAGMTWWSDEDVAIYITSVEIHPMAGELTTWLVAGGIPVTALAPERLPATLSLEEPAILRIRDESGREIFLWRQGRWDPRSSKQIRSQAVMAATLWTVELETDWSELVPPLLRFENLIFVVVVAALVISLTSAYFGLRNIASPLQQLNQIANRIGWGDFDAAAEPVGGVREIEDLRLAMWTMAKQIRQYQQELQSYIGAMTVAQEEERRRLARELHDSTVQALIAFSQQLELVERRLSTDPERARQRLRELRPLIGETITDLRRQIHDLRSLYLEDLGFVPALEMLVQQLRRRHHLVADLDVQGVPRRLDAALEISAYRIVQEALHNVATHAQATWVHVELVFEPAGITLRIEDNGRGFVVPENPSRLAQQGHFGLVGIQERAQLHGGWLRIQSTPGQGTVLVVHLRDPSVDTSSPPSPSGLQPQPE